MSITYDLIKSISKELYERSLKSVPEDTIEALQKSLATETNEIAKENLKMMLKSVKTAEQSGCFLCADSGIPQYLVKIGTRLSIEGDIKKAITDGFDELVKTISPPILEHVTNPLTLERSYKGKDVPIVDFDLIYGADYIELICSPKGLGSGQWADLHIFSFPPLETIEQYIMECVMRAGSQHCPPVIIGIGIGGTFDYTAKMAKEALLRPLGTQNPDPFLAQMEERLLKNVNETGIGAMGTGGDTTALAVHINYSAGHGFTPVAVCFNCWINRRISAKVFNDGSIEYF
jgi:fumarate hydratase subunit alpha